MNKIVSDCNHGQPDPITNRSLSNACWNGRHINQKVLTPHCTGWKEQCEQCGKKHGDKIKECHCSCHTRRCECACHDPQQFKPRVKRDKNATMSIMESGCGEIHVGPVYKVKP